MSERSSDIKAHSYNRCYDFAKRSFEIHGDTVCQSDLKSSEEMAKKV